MPPKKIILAADGGPLGSPQNPTPPPVWNSQMASQIQNDALQRASQVDSAQRYDHADYIAYQRMQLLAQKKERDLTADETAKLQGIANSAKSLNPSVVKELKSASSIRPTDPAEGLLVKAPRTVASSSPRASAPPYVGPSTAPVIGEKLTDLVNSIDPSFKLTPEAEEVLLSLADRFVDSVVEDSCKLASHRVTSGGKPDVSPPPGGVNPLIDVTDVNLILKEKWGISVPGLGKSNVNDNITPMVEIGSIFRTGGVWSEGTEDKQPATGGKGKKRARGK